MLILRSLCPIERPDCWSIYWYDGEYHKLDERTFPTKHDADIAISQYIGIGPY